MNKLDKKIISKLGPYFYRLAESSQDVFWVRSLDFKTQIYVSPAFERVWGSSVQLLYSNPGLWQNLVVKTDKDRMRQELMEWQASSEPGQVFEVRYSIKTAAGEIKLIHDTGMPICDGDKRIGYVGAAKDMTSSILTTIKDNVVDYFRFFAERCNSIFWVRSLDGDKQLYVSPAYEQIWGKSCESLYEEPTSWLDTIHPEDRDHCLANISIRAVRSRVEGPQRFENRFRIIRPDGEIRWIKDINFVIDNEAGEQIGFAGIAEDITQDALREKSLLEAKEQAEKANQTKFDFLAMMSHELRTPLNAILGMTQILTSFDLGDEFRDKVDVIAQSGQNLLHLLNDILDFAKLEVGKLSFTKEAIPVFCFVEQVVVDMMDVARNKNIALETDMDVDVPANIYGDSKRLRQILINLISNAIKFTDKGYVKIKINCLQRTNKVSTLCFTIEDTGIGIEDGKLDSIFRRFQQIDSVYQRKYDGVGLGLAIVKELVERMDGSIAVSSEAGLGSQFTCIIPFDLIATDTKKNAKVLKHSPSKAVNPVAMKSITNFRAKVLVVEDNAINQKIAKALLEQLGCEVDLVSDGKQALYSASDDYDIIFMDIGLPDVDGFEVTRRIRAKSTIKKRIPIIAMTAHVFGHDRKHCFEVGMDEVVAKPVMQDNLIEVLHRWARVEKEAEETQC